MDLRIVTWNLQGRERPALAVVADVVREIEPDVVLLQEVQRRQARTLASMLDWRATWRFKHWPVVIPAEGLAILTPASPPDVDRIVLAHRWSFWSSRRRIALRAVLCGVDVVDVHLGAGVGEEERIRQAAITATLVRGTGVVAGDLNATPGSATLETFARTGLRDVWPEVGEGRPGPTNWRAGPRTGPPVQRLDYVLATGDLGGSEPVLPLADHARFSPLSDHLPLAVTISTR